MAAKRKPEQSKELPPTIKVGYMGVDPELQGSRWEIPRQILYPAKGTAPKMTPTQWIESKAREIAEKQAAVAEEDKRNQAILSQRLEEQRIAEQEANTAAEEAEQAAAAEADRQRKRQAREELKGDLDRLASSSLQAANAIQGKAEVIEQTCQLWEERIQARINEAEQVMSQLQELKSEIDARIGVQQTAEGSNSLNIYRIRKEVDSIKRHLNL